MVPARVSLSAPIGPGCCLGGCFVSEPALDPLERLAFVVDHSLELSIAKLLEQGRKARAGLEAVAHQVVAVQKRGRVDRTGRLRFEIAPAIVDFLAVAERRQRVGFVQGEKLLDPRRRPGFA